MVGGETIISGQEAIHLTRVLRLKAGEDVVVLSPDGGEYLGKIRMASADKVAVDILSRFASGADPGLQLTVAMGFLKEKKMDELIRPLTELGMSRFQPFFAGRSVSRPDPGRMAGRVRRWEKIARESIKQCRRGVVPEINSAISFNEAIAGAATDDLKILFYEDESPGGPFPGLEKGDVPPRITILLGPEGGLAADEVSAAKAAGFTICSLGPRILKAETAAIAACTIVQFMYGDMGLPE